MIERLHAWRQSIREHWIIAIIIAFMIVIILIFIGYFFDWTGFNGYNQVSISTDIASSPHKITRTEVYQSGKTLWDWLQLLIIPFVLAIAALLFNLATTRAEQKIVSQRYEQDQKIALDKQREDLLQIYLDRMSELLLKEKLRSSALDAEVRNVARVRTITILFQLDARRIGYVFAFLRESGLTSNKLNSSIVSFDQADLSKVDFSEAAIFAVDLSGANLNEANLSGAWLIGANLSGTYFRQAKLTSTILAVADLSGASLSGADLSGADLSGADLSGADLNGADLRNADLHANLSGAYLRGANLSGADLSRADLSRADLSGADLSGAFLFEAKITKEQLKEVKSLQGAIMPDGSKHP